MIALGAADVASNARATYQSVVDDPADDQLEFFPIAVTITPLDPREVLGASTRVRGVWKVEYPGERRPHLVYHDRHGWYCEEHGPGCRSVKRVRGK